MLEGFRPGVMDRLGFGAEVVRHRLPRMVHVSIGGYGQAGPDRLLPGHDFGFQGRAGLHWQIAAKTTLRWRSLLGVAL